MYQNHGLPVQRTAKESSVSKLGTDERRRNLVTAVPDIRLAGLIRDRFRDVVAV